MLKAPPVFLRGNISTFSNTAYGSAREVEYQIGLAALAANKKLNRWRDSYLDYALMDMTHQISSLNGSKCGQVTPLEIGDSFYLEALRPMWLARALILAVSACLVMAQPQIVVQPQARYADAGTSISLSATTTGTLPVTYQWHFAENPLLNATNRILTLSSAQPYDSGPYFVVVEDTSGVVTSRVVQVKVFAAAVHGLSISKSAGEAEVGISGEVRALFNRFFDLHPIEASSNMVDWSPLRTITRSNASVGRVVFTVQTASSSAHFYRTPTNQFITPLPEPSGPFPVGSFSMLITDPSRTDSVRRTNVQFMVTFWYPAKPQAGVVPMPYVEKPLIDSSRYGNFANLVPFFYGHSLTNAPLSADKPSYPVLLYSCGGGNHRRDNVGLTEAMASWGYVVAGLDHRDSFASVFPDGKVIRGTLDTSTVQALVKQLEERTADARLMLDELAKINLEHPVLRGRLDLERIGAFGFSFGGAMAAELARTDPRCKASGNIDGTFWKTNLLSTPLTTPFLCVRADGADPASPTDDRRKVFNALGANSYWLKLTNTVHASFSEFSLIYDPASFQGQFAAPPPDKQTSGLRSYEIVGHYFRSFFNKHLLGEDDHLLDKAPTRYPEIRAFIKK